MHAHVFIVSQGLKSRVLSAFVTPEAACLVLYNSVSAGKQEESLKASMPVEVARRLSNIAVDSPRRSKMFYDLVLRRDGFAREFLHGIFGTVTTG